MKRCAECRHAKVLVEEEQIVCLHPNVATPSVAHTGRIIGMHSGACRYSARHCGPDGTWWEAMPEGQQ